MLKRRLCSQEAFEFDMQCILDHNQMVTMFQRFATINIDHFQE